MNSPPHIPRQNESWHDVTIIVDAQNRIRHIGKELRYEYDAIAREPLPQEFIDLLEKLERRTS
jgi:hypothetical protein